MHARRLFSARHALAMLLRDISRQDMLLSVRAMARSSAQSARAR